ncbi:MAG: sterol desaturase family protein [Bacteroidetes bacterium]|nr:sterol desaturase family protein [Bacteroidota bacterium]
MEQQFRELVLIYISTPLYAVVIAVEILFSHLHNKGFYSTKGIFANAFLMYANMGIDILMRTACLAVLNYFFQFRLIESYYSVIFYWALLFFAEDFMYYWLHRIDHHCRLFWAVHVTHHNSNEFNLTVGFRSSVFQPLYRFIYFIPLSLLGFKGIDIMFMYSATQIYGILVHTQTIKKMGLLEYILVTPSHHRVHHASNVQYLDKNMGMVLIIWDRLFGSFQKEDDNDPVRYGLTKNINTNNPSKIVFHEWISIIQDLQRKCSFKNKLMYVFGPPGWSHDGSSKTSRQMRQS